VQNQQFARFSEILYFVEQSCFPHSGFTGNDNELAFATDSRIKPALKFTLFALSADKRRRRYARQHHCLGQDQRPAEIALVESRLATPQGIGYFAGALWSFRRILRNTTKDQILEIFVYVDSQGTRSLGNLMNNAVEN
jgi:hypothetical protein